MGFTVKNSLIAVVRIIDGFNEWVGRAVSWLVVLMVINVFCVVVLRYIFSVGWIWMQETYVWMHGTVFMLGAGYTLLHDGHVRIDLFYREASARYKAAVNLVGSLSGVAVDLAHLRQELADRGALLGESGEIG